MVTWRVVRGLETHYQRVGHPDVVVHAARDARTGEYTYTLMTSAGVHTLLSHSLDAALSEAASLSNTEGGS